jgi:hypothetical protein
LDIQTLGIGTAEKWYSEDIAVLRNEGVQTDTEVLNNKPDIIKNKTGKSY